MSVLYHRRFRLASDSHFLRGFGFRTLSSNGLRPCLFVGVFAVENVTVEDCLSRSLGKHDYIWEAYAISEIT